VSAFIPASRGEQRFLARETITLADLHAYPMLHYFIETPEGAALLEDFPRLQQWLHDMQNRDSVRATGFNTNANDDNDAVDEPGR
jgi:glutathione S-transferase